MLMLQDGQHGPQGDALHHLPAVYGLNSTPTEACARTPKSGTIPREAMPPPAPERYDYVRFTKMLADLHANEMLFELQEEIQAARRDAEQRQTMQANIARQAYLRKLSRLVLFLRRNEIPKDLTPAERKAFAMVAEGLVEKGELPKRVLLEVLQGT